VARRDARGVLGGLWTADPDEGSGARKGNAVRLQGYRTVLSGALLFFIRQVNVRQDLSNRNFSINQQPIAVPDWLNGQRLVVQYGASHWVRLLGGGAKEKGSQTVPHSYDL